MRKLEICLAAAYALSLSLVLAHPILRLMGDGGLASGLALEDGPLETIGALASLIGGCLVAVALLWGRRADELPGATRRQRWFLWFLSISFLLMFLEETSWCQRILHYQTPAWLAAINTPREATLHNLVLFQPTLGVNRLQLVLTVIAAGYFFLVPILSLVPPARAALTRVGLYLPPWWIAASLLLLFLINAALDRVAPRTPPPRDIQEACELLETAFELTCGFVAMTIFLALATRGALIAQAVLAIGVIVPLSIALLGQAIPASIAAARSEGIRLHADCVTLDRGRDEALPLFEKAARLWPGNWRAHLQLGMAARERDDTPTAILHFREVVRLQPESAGLRLLLGVELASSGDYDAAREEILRSLELSGPSVVSLIQLAVVDAALGWYDEAMESLERALELEPENEKVQRKIDQLRQSQPAP